MTQHDTADHVDNKVLGLRGLAVSLKKILTYLKMGIGYQQITNMFPAAYVIPFPKGMS